ncbi:MAG: hypothetical protein AB1592_13375 [Pseudomonadota bacterium]
MPKSKRHQKFEADGAEFGRGLAEGIILTLGLPLPDDGIFVQMLHGMHEIAANAPVHFAGTTKKTERRIWAAAAVRELYYTLAPHSPKAKVIADDFMRMSQSPLQRLSVSPVPEADALLR